MSRSPVTTASVTSTYARPPSFTDLLPWVEYIPESQCFLLEDGVSLGAVFELQAVGTEARPLSFMTQLRDALQNVISDSIPEEEGAPWVLQLFVEDEPSLTGFVSSVAQYLNGQMQPNAYSEKHLRDLASHCRQISQPGGLFDDGAVTGTPWRGRVRRVRATVYRRVPGANRMSDAATIEASLNDVAVRWVAALTATGIQVTRCNGEDFYNWLLPWFNPKAPFADGDRDRLSRLAPYPGDEDMPYGQDFAQSLTLSTPRSNAAAGTWEFDGLPHAIVSAHGLRRAPDIGHLTAERRLGDHTVSLFDRLPEHCVVGLTVTLTPQDVTRAHIDRTKRGAVGDSAVAALTREDADRAEREIASGNKLYPFSLVVYFRGDDESQLQANRNQINALLLSSGIQPIAHESELLAVDSYVRNLPMAYDVRLDRVRRRSRLVFSKHIANLLPLYGRSRGTGNPGMVFFNRGAEPLVFDPLNRNDRKKNAHMLILGPTGAGKSALLVYLLQQMMAAHRPRVFIIEAGGSFSLLGRHFAEHDLTVNQVTLNPGTDVSLPPFSDALKLVQREEAKDHADSLDSNHVGGFAGDDTDADAELEGRDILGEMEIAARLMITGGDEREDARMSRADRFVIRNAILLAARTVSEAGRDQVLTRDVVAAFQSIAKDKELPEPRRHRALEMADGMALFCSGLAGHFFDRAGTPWPAADVTILELGVLAREGYQDQLNVAYVSIMSHINDLVERHQNDARATIVVTDEGHMITTNPLLAKYVVKITKMWRKLGAWFWIGTQNLADFPDGSRRMLNMMEWWLCLVMPKEEVEQIARFKDLTDEQRSLLLSARKEPGKYVEGVVLSDKLDALFRNVPPPLSLALAMTEKHEKAERAQIMREKNCSELQAVQIIADRMACGRQNDSDGGESDGRG